MNYREAMVGAEEAGTVRRNKRRILYRRIVWSLGAIFLVWMTIYWSKGPLEKYRVARDEKKTQAVLEAAHPKPTQAAQTQAAWLCPNVSASQTRTCLVTTEWSNWIQFADGAFDNGKQICFPYGVDFERQQVGDATQWRFRTQSGTMEIKYRLFAATDSCATVRM
jgi:hypothetical protein